VIDAFFNNGPGGLNLALAVNHGYVQFRVIFKASVPAEESHAVVKVRRLQQTVDTEL
jgi:hypothetical protein